VAAGARIVERLMEQLEIAPHDLVASSYVDMI